MFCFLRVGRYEITVVRFLGGFVIGFFEVR